MQNALPSRDQATVPARRGWNWSLGRSSATDCPRHFAADRHRARARSGDRPRRAGPGTRGAVRAMGAMPGWGLLVLIAGWGIAPHRGRAQSQLRDTPLPPVESATLMETEEGWNAHLVACEPLVVDPVEAAFDDAGRLWVVEMRDYPYRVSEQPKGRIGVLVDQDGDGKYDAARTFADGLEMPTGLALWRDGVVVTVAGELLFLRDTDGDLRADTREQWLTGFAQDNEQLRANHPRLGPDGWWYIACGLRGGSVQLGDHYNHRLANPIEIGKRDIRFLPATGDIEPVTGPAQFGLAFDLFGSRIFCSNRNPAVQVILEQSDLADNPLAGIVPATLDVLPAGADSRVYPMVEAWTTSNLHAGQFTAACGVFTMPVPIDADGRRDAAESSGNEILQWVFVCEPTGSLVKREALRRGTSHLERVPSTERPAQREWLASRDPWFRPVNVDCAPDGSVMIVDMHRAVIEHPQWVPEELKHRPDERWGDAAGRIYSVAFSSRGASEDSDDSAPAARPVRLRRNMPLAAAVRDLGLRPLRTRSSPELVNLLRMDNSWMYQTVARLLVERSDDSVVPILSRTVTDPEVPPGGRIAAAQVAMLLSPRLAQTVRPWLHPAQPPWLRTAILARLRRLPPDRWCEIDRPEGQPATRTQESAQARPAETDRSPAHRTNDPESTATIAGMLHRSAERGGAEQFEALLCLRYCPAHRPSDALLQSVAQTPDPWLLAAAAGAFADATEKLLFHWWMGLARRDASQSSSEPIVSIAQTLCRHALPAGTPHASDPAQPSTVRRIATGLSRPGISAVQLGAGLAILRTAWPRWTSEATANDGASPSPLEQAVRRARSIAGGLEDGELPDWVHVEAIRFLSALRRSGDAGLWRELVEQEQPPPRWQAALEAWFRVEPEACGRFILDRLPQWTPIRQRAALELIPRNPEVLEALIGALETGTISPRQLGASAIERLAARVRGESAVRLRAIAGKLSNTNRAKVLERYRPALNLRGDPRAGRAVFQQHCASCHRIGDAGTQVGPDISDSRTKSPEQLLVAILDPNAAIDAAYFRYTVLTSDDQVVEGLVAEETPNAVVLLLQDGRRQVIARSAIAEMRSSGISLMPEGFEAQIPPQQMADLIAYIKGWRYMQGTIPIEDGRPDE